MVNVVPKVFPDPPSSYLELERVNVSKEFSAPEDGYFEFIGLAKSGDGGRTDISSHGGTCYTGGGSGGSGGVVVSVFKLNKGDVVSLSVSTSVTISRNGEVASATPGGNGTDGNESYHGHYTKGTGGSAGGASGGNIENIPGSKGKDGGYNQDISSSAAAGASVSNGYNGYNTISGNGNSGKGTTAYIMVLRGNTNLPLSQLNALELSGLMLEMNYIFQEQTEMLTQSTQ